MNPTITNPATQNPNRVLTVEYYPSVNDFAYVADQLSQRSTSANSFVVYVYYVYLALNLLAVPIVFWFGDMLVAGTLVFVFNLVAILFLLPNINRSQYKQYYRNLYGDLENHKATLEISNEGVRYECRGNDSFLPWKNITRIEETDTSIYFHFEHNAISVQKSGFAYPNVKNEFLSFAREQQGRAKLQA